MFVQKEDETNVSQNPGGDMFEPDKKVKACKGNAGKSRILLIEPKFYHSRSSPVENPARITETRVFLKSSNKISDEKCPA